MGDNVKVTTGPTSDLKTDESVRWDYHTRQGVHLLPEQTLVSPGVELRVALSFSENTGECTFTFHL